MKGSAPGRVNLIGEHTDYNDGFVLPMAIGLHVEAEAVRRNDGLVIATSMTEERFVVGEESKKNGWIDYVQACTWAMRAAGQPTSGFDLRITGTLPKGAGLGSSASLMVAVLRALGADDVAALAHRGETDFVGAPVGTMDSLSAAFGRVDEPLLIDTRSGEMRRLELPIGASIVVLHSGVTHANQTSAYRERRAQCEEACRILGIATLRDADMSLLGKLPELLRKRARHVLTENDRVLRVAKALENGHIGGLGTLFDESHCSMRDDYAITIPEVDRLVDALRRQRGVCGARMTGGGFGGAVIGLVESGSEGAAAEAAVGECPGSFSLMACAR